jgi:hypothetical protein
MVHISVHVSSLKILPVIRVFLILLRFRTELNKGSFFLRLSQKNGFLKKSDKGSGGTAMSPYCILRILS